jgi:glyoxylase-like metal-dependent hydrolase (beta-lactamase superfamily II)
MTFGHFRLNLIEVNAFVYACPETREAVLVDCGEFDPQIPEFIQQHRLKLTTIFITHDHYDHVQGLRDAATHSGAMVVAGTEAPGGYRADRVIQPGETVEVGTLTGRVVDTSGHSPVGLSLIFPDRVFTGDALFAGSVGGTTNPEDYERQNANIRENLFPLPDDTLVHCGHGPSSTIGVEKRYNPFFV